MNNVNGYHYNAEIGEYEIWFGDEIWTYAGDRNKASEIYVQILQSEREHRERCPQDYYGLEAVA